MENKSIWEQESFFTQDIIIVGGGLIGLFIAYQTQRDQPNKKILVLERGIIPTGASLKNLGIICCADIPGIIDDMNAFGVDYVVEDAKERLQGIQEYQNLFEPETIGFQQQGFYEFFYENELAFLDQVDSINKLLRPVFNDDVFEIRNEKIKEFGMNTDIFKGALYNKYEASLDSGKLIRNLIKKFSELGGLYLTGSKVISHTKLNQDLIEVNVENPLKKNTILKFHCNKLLYAINGFAKSQFPETPLISGKGQIICSKPNTQLPKFQGTYANDFYYFRILNDRLMIGGGSRIDFKKIDVYELNNSESVIKHIKREITKAFPKLNFEVDLEWNGLMAFSNDPNKMYQGPMIKILEDNVMLVCRLCGNGVSIAPLLSKKISGILQAQTIKIDEAKL